MADPTPEQNKQIEQIAKEWIVVGRSAGPTDKRLCEQAVMLAYEVAKLPPPLDEEGKPCILWVQNPKEGMRLAAMFLIMDAAITKAGFDWHANKPPAVAHLDLRRQAEEAYKLLGLKEPDRQQRNEQRQTACYGVHDVYWVAFYRAMELLKADALGRDPTTGKCVLDGLEAMTKCGWWWPFERAVILSEMPVQAAFDNEGRLSNRNGPAMTFPGGYRLWMVDGVQVLPVDGDGGEAGRRIIEREFSAQEILDQPNMEVRRIMMELYGEGRFIEGIGAKPVHSDAFGTLFSVEIPGDERLVLVRVDDATPMPDGTRQVYYLRVHPELRPLLQVSPARFGNPQAPTARNAVASLAGLTGAEYAPRLET